LWPWLAAFSKGVRSSLKELSRASTLAPARSSNSQDPYAPEKAARCKGEHINGDAELTEVVEPGVITPTSGESGVQSIIPSGFAPFSSRKRTISTWSACAAKCNGV
jgi:hypothetical protein